MSEPGFLQQFYDVTGTDTIDDQADVVIIGSGAAGATAARVLAERGVDVVIVEEGPSIPSEELRGDVYTGFSRVWREMGTQVAKGRAYIPVLQGVCVGGTTAINGAIIHRLPEPIFDIWCREHGVGTALSYAQLDRIFETMDRELSVAPTSDEVLGGNNLLMRRGLSALGLSGNPIRRNVIDCGRSARCLQGCATARKQSMDVTYVPSAIARGARLYATCKVGRIRTAGGRVTGIEARFADPETGRKGPRLHVAARHAVIVAASAIQTPLLLARAGVGRSSGLVGKRLQAHPGTAVVGVFDEPVRIWDGATQGYESTHFWNERMKLESLALPVELGAVRLPGMGPALMEELADYGHITQWGVQVRARAHGRVRRSLGGGAAIRYDMTNDDVKTMKRGVRVLTEMCFAAGAREVLPGVHGLPDRIRSVDGVAGLDGLPDDPRLFHSIAAHLFGTAVMGTDPATSVVAPDGQAHELTGLYVADSSVFPTNLGVNPQHSIAAIAWATAERIAERIGC